MVLCLIEVNFERLKKVGGNGNGFVKQHDVYFLE